LGLELAPELEPEVEVEWRVLLLLSSWVPAREVPGSREVEVGRGAEA